MRKARKMVVVAAAVALSASGASAQQEAPARPALSGRGGGLGRGGDPNRCAAPGGMGTANYKSAEQLPDGRVTFRICAPDATTVSLGSSDNDDIAPNVFTGGTGRAMTKDDKGLWSV